MKAHQRTKAKKLTFRKIFMATKRYEGIFEDRWFKKYYKMRNGEYIKAQSVREAHLIYKKVYRNEH